MRLSVEIQISGDHCAHPGCPHLGAARFLFLHGEQYRLCDLFRNTDPARAKCVRDSAGWRRCEACVDAQAVGNQEYADLREVLEYVADPVNEQSMLRQKYSLKRIGSLAAELLKKIDK